MNPIVPILGCEEPDKYGRGIKVGVNQGWTNTYLPIMNFQEAVHLRDALSKLIEDLENR